MTVTITLPLPPKELNPNKQVASRGGRMAKNRATDKYKTAAKVQVLATVAGGWKPRWKTPTIQVEYYFPTMAFRDPDNCIATLKSAFDGLSASGLLDDDRDVTYLPVKRSKDAKNPRVVIHISDQ